MLVGTLACLLMFGLVRAPAASAASTRAELKLLHAMNNARTTRGLARLRIGAGLQTGAHAWAVYLRRRNLFRHYGGLTNGTSENIGWLTCRQGWAAVLVRMWLASPAHRANLLDRGARRTGVGVSRGPYTYSGTRYSCVRMAVTRFH
ncbi:MAG TPA: CAP domain-containing protein [Gaiellaceae bacterium]|jgi:uncharacterized protein YkwD|nr:CAP domain-containing protein [Gaiellaceae bacterium]